MPNPLLFVGKGAALTAAARAADKANEGGVAFQRLGEGRGAAIRLAWPAEALHTVPHERRAAAGDAEKVQTAAKEKAESRGSTEKAPWMPAAMAAAPKLPKVVPPR